MKNVVLIGGGTGTFVVLSGLKKYDLNLSVIVSMMDSGGSTGRLRDQYGVLPPGDLRQCLVALSQTSSLLRKLFLYRFESGDLKGHNFGNLFITALEKITDNYQDVVDAASKILNIKGKVIPVTFDKADLFALYQDGELLESEGIIDVAFHKTSPIIKAYLKPPAKANIQALKAIEKADYIIFGPGDIYTGIVPNLLVEGIKKAIIKSPAKIIYIVNLFTKNGQTTNYKASDHIADIVKYSGKNINYVLLNSKPIPQKIATYYKKHNELIVIDDLPKQKNIYRLDLIQEKMYQKPKGDLIFRSILRHDSLKVANALSSIIIK